MSDERRIDNLRYLFAKLPKSLRKKIGVEIIGDNDNPVISITDNPFFEYIKNTEIRVIAAEDVLVERSSHYKKLFEKVEETDAYKKRVELEKEGVKSLEEGTYGKPKD